MLNIIKKTCIAALFSGYILLPMDPPTQESVTISIFTVLDANIQYFSNEIAALDDKITRAKSREHLRQQLESEKSGLQQLLKLNQSFKQQWQSNLNERLQNPQQLLYNWDEEQKKKDAVELRAQQQIHRELQRSSNNLAPVAAATNQILQQKEPENKRNRINRMGYSMCAGIAVFMISTACIIKYLYPHGLFQ